MQRRAFLSMMPLALAGCAAESVWAPDDVISRAYTPGSGRPSLTLYTMRNVDNGGGAHSSLMIDASQRVMFDPAGTFRSPYIPERNDVLFGLSPEVEGYYVSFHARATFWVLGQKVEVPAAVAEEALRLALANGPVAEANCTRATSTLLSKLPGFSSIRTTWFPNALAEAFGALPGVVETEYRESDDDDKSIAQAQINMILSQRR